MMQSPELFQMFLTITSHFPGRPPSHPPPSFAYPRWLQTTCGVNAQGVPSNSAFHALFSLASTLGDEAFYTVALPLGAWMLDLELTRRLAFFWVSVYYVGQATKVR